MKKILFTALSIFVLSSPTFAQTTSEILQLSQNNALGTARFNGLSGAFGALGGDLTALTINPAGSAVFKNSYGSVTLEQNGSSSRSSFFGNNQRNNNANLNFNQIGAVLILKNTSGKGPSKIALGLSYNKTNNFRNRIDFSGETNNSIANYFVDQANGLNTGALITGNRSDTDAYLDLSDGPNGRENQRSYLGFQSILIDPVQNTDNNTLYQSNVNSANNFQNHSIESSGSSSKITFNLGLEASKNLQVGANLNFHNINRTQRISFAEQNDFTSNFAYEITERTFGSGFSIDLGGILKADNFRFGVSYQSPTWHELSNEVNEFTNADFVNEQNINGEIVQFRDVDPNVTVEFEPYRFRTPGTISGSIAFIAGKKGLISAQYSRKDFSNTQFTSGGSVFNQLNATIENTFTTSETYRIGGEYRHENWRLRGGFSKVTSPYRDTRIAGDTDGFSLGTGYNWGKWKLDAAYNRTVTERREALFESENFNNFADVNQRISAVTLTLGVNF